MINIQPIQTANGQPPNAELLKQLLVATLKRDDIPSLTFTDPWGTLVAMGEKRYETRSWNTLYRGPLAIHISSTLTSEARWMCSDQVVSEILETAGYTHDIRRRFPWALPLRKVVALAWLEDIHAIQPGFQVTARERHFGNYRYGRFAWEFSTVYRLQQPHITSGNRMIWKWSPPESFWNEIQGRLDALREEAYA